MLAESSEREQTILPARLEAVQDSIERNRLATIATTDTFENEVLQSDGKVIVDFWAEWCGPCHAVSPVLDRIADEHQVKIVKVNIDEQQDLAQRYGVSSIPFMVLFENGEPQASAVGAMPEGLAREGVWGWRRRRPPPPASNLYFDSSRNDRKARCFARYASSACTPSAANSSTHVSERSSSIRCSSAWIVHARDHRPPTGRPHEPFGPFSGSGQPSRDSHRERIASNVGNASSSRVRAVVRAEPAELDEVVAGDFLSTDDMGAPRETEDGARPVRLVPRPEELDDLDLETRLLTNLTV